MSLLSEKGRRMLGALGVPLDIGASDGIVVGFSGGADSAALLHFLAVDMHLCSRITALHVNHMLRGDDAERDERFCRDFCSMAPESRRSESMGRLSVLLSGPRES